MNVVKATIAVLKPCPVNVSCIWLIPKLFDRFMLLQRKNRAYIITKTH